MTTTTTGNFSNADIDALEDVVIIPARAVESMWISFLVGVANLSEFSVDFRTNPAGEWFAIANVALDFTSPEGPVLGASGNLTTAAFGATVHFLSLNVRGVDSVRLRAAGTSSTITGTYGAF